MSRAEGSRKEGVVAESVERFFADSQLQHDLTELLQLSREGLSVSWPQGWSQLLVADTLAAIARR